METNDICGRREGSIFYSVSSHFAESHFAESHFADSHFAESHFADSHFAELPNLMMGGATRA